MLRNVFSIVLNDAFSITKAASLAQKNVIACFAKYE